MPRAKKSSHLWTGLSSPYDYVPVMIPAPKKKAKAKPKLWTIRSEKNARFYGNGTEYAWIHQEDRILYQLNRLERTIAKLKNRGMR